VRGLLYPVPLSLEERGRLVEDLLVGPGDVVSAWVAVALEFHVGECARGVCGCGCGCGYSSLVTPAAKLLESACTCTGKVSGVQWGWMLERPWGSHHARVGGARLEGNYLFK